MYVISIGAGKNQVPLIKRLVARGYNVVSFDKDINAPGKSLSYIFSDISTWDYSSAIQWLDSLELRFKACLCFSYGIALISQQKIIEHYNLECQIKDSFINIMADKSIQRKTLNNFKLSTLKENDNVIYSKDNRYFIVKDKIGGSSNKVFLIENRDNGHEIIGEYLKNDNYIIQEYLEGIEYRGVVIVKDRTIRFISIMEKDNLQDTFFTGRLAPKINHDEEIVFLIERVIQRFEVIDSVIKIDIIKEKDRLEILEIDFGICGDYFETLISNKCYNYDFIDNYINLMIGLPVEEKTTLDKDLCFDYIYNINKKENLTTNYNKICDIANQNFTEYEIIEIKRDGEEVRYPQSNMDAVFGIIHNRKDLSNYDINILFNKALFK